MADWNWFLTALAQSAAAIVGFFGGFVISKIIARDSEYHTINELILSTTARIQDQERKLKHRYFDWYNQRRRESIRKSQDFENIVLKGQGKPNYQELRTTLNYSPYDSQEEIYSEIESSWGLGPRPFSVILPFSASLSDAIIAEREAIDKELVSTEALITDIRNIIGRMAAFPHGAGLTRVSLLLVALLFLIGVIVPLSLSPADSIPTFSSIYNKILIVPLSIISPKGILLSSVSLLFLIIIGIFMWIESKHVFSKGILTDLGKAMHLSYYSPYFDNFEKQLAVIDKTAT